MALIECSIKFRLPCYSSLAAWNALEALFSLVVELLSSATTSLVLFFISKTSFSGNTRASFVPGFLYTPSFVRNIADRITPSDRSMVSVTWPWLQYLRLLLSSINQTRSLSLRDSFTVVCRLSFLPVIQSWQRLFTKSFPFEICTWGCGKTFQWSKNSSANGR